MSFSAILKNPKEDAGIGRLAPSGAVTEGALGTLSYLNGLVAAVLVGPEKIPAGEWMGCFLEGMEDASAEEDAFLAKLMVVEHSKTADRLSEPGGYEPEFWNDRDGNLITRDWAEGFCTGIRLRSDAWKPFLEGKGRVFVGMLSALLRHGEIGAETIEPGEDAKAAFEFAREKLGPVLQALYAIREEPPLVLELQEAKTGRNDPCPCGSGKKYKKCCLN